MILVSNKEFKFGKIKQGYSFFLKIVETRTQSFLNFLCQFLVYLRPVREIFIPVPRCKMVEETTLDQWFSNFLVVSTLLNLRISSHILRSARIAD